MQSKPMTATKSDLISAIAEENGFPQNKSAEVIKTLIGLIKTKLAAGEDVLIKRDFGLSGVVRPRPSRLRFLHQMRSHSEMLKFRIGDRVEFQYEGRRSPVVGMLTCYNKKTVTVITDSGQRWNVAPRLLRRAAAVVGQQAPDPNLIRLHKK
jgi:nucleoid DNA-binding protein